MTADIGEHQQVPAPPADVVTPGPTINPTAEPSPTSTATHDLFPESLTAQNKSGGDGDDTSEPSPTTSAADLSAENLAAHDNNLNAPGADTDDAKNVYRSRFIPLKPDDDVTRPDAAPTKLQKDFEEALRKRRELEAKQKYEEGVGVNATTKRGGEGTVENASAAPAKGEDGGGFDSAWEGIAQTRAETDEERQARERRRRELMEAAAAGRKSVKDFDKVLKAKAPEDVPTPAKSQQEAIRAHAAKMLQLAEGFHKDHLRYSKRFGPEMGEREEESSDDYEFGSEGIEEESESDSASRMSESMAESSEMPSEQSQITSTSGVSEEPHYPQFLSYDDEGDHMEVKAEEEAEKEDAALVPDAVLVPIAPVAAAAAVATREEPPASPMAVTTEPGKEPHLAAAPVAPEPIDEEPPAPVVVEKEAAALAAEEEVPPTPTASSAGGELLEDEFVESSAVMVEAAAASVAADSPEIQEDILVAPVDEEDPSSLMTKEIDAKEDAIEVNGDAARSLAVPSGGADDDGFASEGFPDKGNDASLTEVKEVPQGGFCTKKRLLIVAVVTVLAIVGAVVGVMMGGGGGGDGGGSTSSLEAPGDDTTTSTTATASAATGTSVAPVDTTSTTSAAVVSTAATPAQPAPVTPGPTPQPTPAPVDIYVPPYDQTRFDALASILSTVTSPTLLNDYATPQGKAIVWLAGEDTYLTLAYESSGPAKSPDWAVIQRYAVTTLYYALGGHTNWYEQENFLTPELSECEWEVQLGVGCGAEVTGVEEGDYSEDGGVSSLILENNGLVGSIPEEIGLLVYMDTLDLRENSGLIGRIPASIGNLQELKVLDLYGCSLSGPVLPNPSEGGAVGGLALLTKMNTLDLGGNALTGPVPSEMGLLTDLYVLYLEENSFQGTIPKEWGNLVNLRQWWMFSNEGVTGQLPSELGKLSDLESLLLSGNTLSGTIPTEFANMITMLEMDLSDNLLTGTIPQELGNMTRVNGLWRGLSMLNELILHSNSLSGPIPGTLGEIEFLKVLDLSDNSFTGTLPLELFDSRRYQKVLLDSNDLSGPLPPAVGLWTELKELKLSSNSFSGPLPAELGNCASLTHLEVDGNDFSGTVPTTLAQLSELKSVKFAFNEFTGSLDAMCSREDPINDFTADCDGGSGVGEVTCACCDVCCQSIPGGGAQCMSNLATR